MRILIPLLLISSVAFGDCAKDLGLCREALTATEASRAAYQQQVEDLMKLNALYKEQRDDAQEQAIKARGRSTFLGIGTSEIAFALIGALTVALIKR